MCSITIHVCFFNCFPIWKAWYRNTTKISRYFMDRGGTQGGWIFRGFRDRCCCSVWKNLQFLPVCIWSTGFGFDRIGKKNVRLFWNWVTLFPRSNSLGVRKHFHCQSVLYIRNTSQFDNRAWVYTSWLLISTYIAKRWGWLSQSKPRLISNTTPSSTSLWSRLYGTAKELILHFCGMS